MSRKEQVLWAMKTTLDTKSNSKTLKQIMEEAGIQYEQKSHSAAVPAIWDKLGNTTGGAGLIGRNEETSTYYYYVEDPKFHETSFEDLKQMLKQFYFRKKEPTVQPAPTVPEVFAVNVSVKVEVRFGWL